MTQYSSGIFFFQFRCEGITSPEGSKSIVEGIIEEEEEDEEGSESVNKRKKEDDMEVSKVLSLERQREERKQRRQHCYSCQITDFGGGAETLW